MAIIKCKMCGGDLNLAEGQTVAECEYCFTTQTVPNVDDDKKLALFTRANRLRASCEFDKAAVVYEAIVADFPEEAEAYWGLVLCRYGIEYVDDPATGKKVPTCHRTCPTPLSGDQDFQEALRKADAVSARLYREEAAQIDHIQQRILSIVSQEEPYDIFICYKETDDDTLRRTEDSSDAQDLFTELTKDGYRVFFARNTLKSVAAGSEYEPYIYAALTSAKVMLVIGSREEYFNAVWVKNEWARFLDMMKSQPGKMLIPCCKNIDPYDMPREFRNLQALNMTDITFYNSLKANLERAIPRKSMAQPEPVFGEAARALSPNLQSLLKRAYMFLEDKDWSSADKYFNDILDIDPECSEAYLGKCLVQHKCSKPESLAAARSAAYQSVRSQTVTAQLRDRGRELAIVQPYIVPGYLEREELNKLFRFNGEYSTVSADRRRQLETENAWFTQDKYMSRALRYASGDSKVRLEKLREDILEALRVRVRTAEKEEADKVSSLRAQYAGLLTSAEEKARAMYDAAIAGRENDYQVCMREAEKAIETNTRNALTAAMTRLQSMGDYKDCRNMLDILQEKLDLIAAAEEAERIRIALEQEEERRRKAEEARYLREVKDAYYAEYPSAQAKAPSEARLGEINTRLIAIENQLRKKAGRVVCWIFFLLGILEFLLGLDGEGFLLIVGGLCFLAFGIALLAIGSSRKKLRKERNRLYKESAALHGTLGDIAKVPTLTEFTRIYELRQTQQGRKLLEEEERIRQLRLRQQQEEARKAKKKRAVKDAVTVSVVLLILAVIGFGIWYVSNHVIPGSRVKKAEAAIAAGDYAGAYDILNGYAPYGDSEALMEQISQNGQYIITRVVRSHTEDYGDAIFTFEYDEKGRLLYMLAYDAEDPGEEDIPDRQDLDHGYGLEYAYYSSGNLKRITLTDVQTGTVSHKIEFHDREEASVQILLGDGLSPDYNQWPSLDLLTFVGAKKHTSYRDKYSYVTNYRENGYDDKTQVILNDAGMVAELRSDDHAYTYTYNRNGTLKHADYDADTAGSSTLYDYSRSYTYRYHLLTGQLLTFRYQDKDREVAECQETYTYDAQGHLTSIRAERRREFSYSSDEYLGWNHTFYIDSQWLDYAAAAAAPAESEGLGILQAGQLTDAMSRSFLEALELLEDMEPVGEAVSLAETLNTYAPYCGEFVSAEDPSLKLHSDFLLDYNDVMWNCRQEENFLGVKVDEELHFYFQEPLEVEDMAVTESFYAVDALMTFAEDKLHYTLGAWETYDTYSSGKIYNKEGYYVVVEYDLLPASQAEAPAA